MKRPLILLTLMFLLSVLFTACESPTQQSDSVKTIAQAGQTDRITSQDERKPEKDPPSQASAPYETESSSAPAFTPEDASNIQTSPKADTADVLSENSKGDNKEDAIQNAVYLSITGVDEQTSILPQEAIQIIEGESVLDLLLRVTKSKKIQMEFSGKNAAAYIKGIDNLYEFDKGEGSGWMVSVNGTFLDKSAGSWTIKEGDVIAWRYTKDLGKDIGAYY